MKTVHDIGEFGLIANRVDRREADALVRVVERAADSFETDFDIVCDPGDLGDGEPVEFRAPMGERTADGFLSWHSDVNERAQRG